MPPPRPLRLRLPLRLPLALAFAFALALGGCLAPSPSPAPSTPADVRTDASTTRDVEASGSGTALASPAAPFTQDLKLEVPTGAVGVNASVEWSDPVSKLRLALVDPDGTVKAEGYPERAGRMVAATLDPPKSGIWIVRVTSTLAANAPFKVRAAAQLIVPDENVVRRTGKLNGFEEVNVIMEGGESFSFSFNASDAIKWDVHSHPESGLKEWQKGEGRTASGVFTAPERGIYSLLFEAPTRVPVDLAFEMRGKFRVHSHAQ